VVELDPDLVDASQKDAWYRGKMAYGESNAIRVFEAVGKSSSLAYYYTVLRVPRPCVVKFSKPMAGLATFWLAGQRLAGEDTTYRLRPGYYPWLVAVTIQREKLPPIGDFALSFGLVQVADWPRAVEAWHRQTAPWRGELLKVAGADPDTPEAAQARAILQQLDATGTETSTPPGSAR
jgi:hypothetical protein